MTLSTEINVTGHGRVSAMPDGMQIDLSVIAQRSDYPQTLEDLNTRVQAIADAASRAGVTESVTTKSYSITEIWSDQYDDEKRKFQGYKANQKMTLTIPLDNALLGNVIKELAKSEGKPGMSITFVVRDRDAMEQGARIAAMTKAKQAASDLAKTVGLTLASVKSISYIADKGGESNLLCIDSLAQYDIAPSPAMTPDVITHNETVHVVWLATGKEIA